MPERLEDIVRCCLAKERRDRYADAAELADALDNWFVDPPKPEVSVPVPVVLFAGAFAGLAAGAALLVGMALGAFVDEPPPPGPPVEPPEAPAEVVPVPAPGPNFAPIELVPVEVTPAATPAPAPAPAPAPTPATGPEAPAVPRPKPTPRAAPAADTIVDGVFFPAAQVSRALTFVNTAPEDALRRAGIYGRGVSVVLDNRPFTSLQAFGDTAQIGPKTVESVLNATRVPPEE